MQDMKRMFAGILTLLILFLFVFKLIYNETFEETKQFNNNNKRKYSLRMFDTLTYDYKKPIYFY